MWKLTLGYNTRLSTLAWLSFFNVLVVVFLQCACNYSFLTHLLLLLFNAPIVIPLCHLMLLSRFIQSLWLRAMYICASQSFLIWKGTSFIIRMKIHIVWIFFKNVFGCCVYNVFPSFSLTTKFEMQSFKLWQQI